MEGKIVERKAKYLRVGDIVIRRKHDKLVTKVEPHASLLSIKYGSGNFDLFRITYDDGSIDDLYQTTSVMSKTPRK